MKLLWAVLIASFAMAGPARADSPPRLVSDLRRGPDNGTPHDLVAFGGALYFTAADNTHTSPEGAELNAACVCEGLRALADCRLKDYLLPEKE